MSNHRSHLLWALEDHLDLSDGRFWIPEGEHLVWQVVALQARFQVAVTARTKVPPRRPSGPQIEIQAAPLPACRGPLQILFGLPRLIRLGIQAVRKADRCLIRGPGAVTSIIWLTALVCRVPYAMELVGDPVASSLANPYLPWRWLRAVVSRLMSAVVRAQVRHAAGVWYLSESLRALYPAKTRSQEFVFSDTALTPEWFEKATTPARTGVFRLLYVGRLSFEKGVDVLLDACKLLAAETNQPWELQLVGDGPMQDQLRKTVAADERLQGRVHFAGFKKRGDELRAEYSNASLFVLPSRTEGLPRALVEAMAQGLPAVGSSVGGIPELLRKQDVVPPENPTALANRISFLLSNGSVMNRLSVRNRLMAQRNRSDVVASLFNGFVESFS